MRITFGLPGPLARPSRAPRRFALLVAAAALAVPALVIAGHQYTDVPDSHPFHGHIAAITNAGLTTGCGGGKFCPDASVTRGQMAAFLNRLGALGPGTTPMVNADRLDGHDADDFLPASTSVLPATTYTIFNEGTILAGDSTSLIASCDDGDQLLSGGYFDVAFATHVFDSYPHPAGHWEVFGVNTSLEDDTVLVYVRCADFAPVHEEPPGPTAPERDPMD